MRNMQIEAVEDRADEASQLLAAMANPKRLLVLCKLLEREMNVTDLSDHVGLGQSSLSQHLSKLRAWGLVKTRRDAQQVNYSLASDAVRHILATLCVIYSNC